MCLNCESESVDQIPVTSKKDETTHSHRANACVVSVKIDWSLPNRKGLREGFQLRHSRLTISAVFLLDLYDCILYPNNTLYFTFYIFQ